MEKHGLLFLNGEVTEKEISFVQSRKFTHIIAADGGTFNALKWGFTPDVVVGDLDSIDDAVRLRLPETTFEHRPSQELNDFEKALQYCSEIGITHLTILGIAGKRLDHTLNNLSVLARYDQKFHTRIYDPYAQIYLLRDAITIQGVPGQLVSLIPVGEVNGIVTEGLAFPLNHERLAFGVREGLSNYLTKDTAHIRIENGLLFVFVHYVESPR